MTFLRTLPFAMLALLALVACDSSAPATQHLPAPTTPQLTLFVSNQSFEMELVDVRVELDGQLAVTGDFEVGSQHTWKKFELPAAPGSHVLRVISADSSARLDETFVMDERKWMVLAFWYERGSANPPRFTWNLMDTEPGFD
jgi:hypothetical protein